MMTVQEYLSRSTQGVLSFLEQHLPAIGGEPWWQKTVIDKLSENQTKLAEQKQFSALNAFDLAALLNLLERNWRAITDRTSGFDYRRGLALIIELRNIRNHYAHEPTSGTQLDQQLRDVDSITRFLKALSADSALVGQGEALHRELMARMLGLETDQSATGDQSASETGKSGGTGEEGDSEETTPEHDMDAPQKGVPVQWLKAGTILEQDLLKKMRSATYVGIDFGTSTSVASIAAVGDDGQGLHTTAIEIRQLDELGREIHSRLVDTCLAWFNQKLLFGVGAARLKQELVGNQTIWTSFKMGLGVDLGPEYNRTALPAGRFEHTIEKPQQAAAVFLKLLYEGIREYVSKHDLPEQIYYTVTVPASFEANQRRDLFAALEFAGIPGSEIRLMDEPNAAFLSYLIDMESRSSEGRFVDALQAKKRNVIVFDFGAGTCDISILEVSVSRESILSRNLGISKFWALGGDDIDKVIAEQVLLPQLCGAENVAKYLFTSTQLEQQVLPRLKPVAEALKIACCELAEHKGWKTIEDLKNSRSKVTGKPGTPFNIAGRDWQLKEPQISLDQFAEIMALFVGQPSSSKGGSKIIDVLQPIDNALEKVELTKDDIDMVLFIGGSCENPLIRHYVSKHLGRYVESITPRDLRAHVSQGAALYTLFLRGADIDPIKPITSETIYVLTAGEAERLEPVVRASSLVPSEGQLQEELVVIRNGQKTIDLPFFSGSVNKPIGLVQLKAPRGSPGFQQGENVKIQWALSKEKILRVVAEAHGIKQTAEFQNPLANEEMTEEVLAMLKAKQAFNKSVLDGNGRPAASVTLAYSNAARKAGNWRLAAEMLEAVERLDPEADHSTTICYCYSMDGDNRSGQKWSAIAYARKPSPVTAYNYAHDKLRNRDIPEYERLMQECLEHDPNYTAALDSYGRHLMEQGDPMGIEYLQRAFDIFKEEMENGELDSADIPRFKRAAGVLGKEEVLSSIEKLHEIVQPKKTSRGFRTENLVGAVNSFGKRPSLLKDS
jgi:molecular chaperone DnaK